MVIHTRYLATSIRAALGHPRQLYSSYVPYFVGDLTPTPAKRTALLEVYEKDGNFKDNARLSNANLMAIGCEKTRVQSTLAFTGVQDRAVIYFSGKGYGTDLPLRAVKGRTYVVVFIYIDSWDILPQEWPLQFPNPPSVPGGD
jgi:hypothetical protein